MYAYLLLGTGDLKTVPAKNKLQEIDKLRVPKYKEAVVCTFIHSALRSMFSKDPLFPTVDEVIAHFRDAWTAEEKLELSAEEKSAYLTQGESILKRFYAKNAPWNFNVVDLESRFEILVEDPSTKEAHVLAGIMDRIDKPDENTYEIIDYKTTRKMKSQEAVNRDLQLSIYHLGLLRRWPHLEADNIRLSLYYVKHGEKLTTTRSARDLENITDIVLTTIHEIEGRRTTSDFPPQPSALCDWCGYKPICPAWKFLYVKREAQNVKQDDIEKIVQEFFSLKKTSQETEQRIAELQAAIKAYMDTEGLTRLFGEGGTIAKKLQERFQYDFEKVKDILARENRMDIWEALFAPDEKKLKQLTKVLPLPLRRELEAARTLTKRYEILTVSSKNTASAASITNSEE